MWHAGGVKPSGVAETVRDQRVVIVVTSDEHELIASLAKRSGLSQSSWLRRLAYPEVSIRARLWHSGTGIRDPRYRR